MNRSVPILLRDSSRVFFLLFAAAAALVQGCQSESARPVARAQPSRHARGIDGLEFPDGRDLDLGEGWENEYITCQFRIKNVSDHPVSFRKAASTTCGCTAGELSLSRLMPGETTVLTVSLNLPSVAGERKQYAATVHRELDDGTVANVSFVTEIVTSAAWYTVPAEVSVRLNAAESRTVKLNVFGSRDCVANIVGTSTTVPGGNVRHAAESLDPFRPVSVTCEIPADAGEGKYQILIQCDDKRFPQRSITVRIGREATFQALPASILLRRSGPDGQFAGKVTILVPGSAGDLQVTGPEGLNCEVGPWREYQAARKMSVVNVTYDGLPSDYAGEEIVVRAVDANMGKVELPIPVRIID